MTSELRSAFEKRVARGEIEPDPAQRHMIEHLDRLQVELEAWRGQERSLLARIGLARPNHAPRGLYMYGGVGRGKTMLMDLFFAEANVQPKRRAHFHEFMSGVHDQITASRATIPGDPIPAVARAIAADGALLCFDELHVTDIADAMILSRLFAGLFEHGVVVVATSNARPDELYRDGLNRQLFLPFIDLIESRMDVVELAAAKDFRLDKLGGRPLYFSPADDAARSAIDGLWARLTGKHAVRAETLDVKGRKLRVARASMGAARFSFAELCDQPLSAADYVAVAHAFHTVIVEDIPIFAADRRDLTRRFINLIDTLYDAGTCLIASAAAAPNNLCVSGPMSELFQRTASRLIEMGTGRYVEARGTRATARPRPDK